LARWERPTRASSSAASDQPGRLLQGPDEKNGRFGLVLGFMVERRQKLGVRSEMSRIRFVKVRAFRVVGAVFFFNHFCGQYGGQNRFYSRISVTLENGINAMDENRTDDRKRTLCTPLKRSQVTVPR
jgi:hypothetical protein